MARKKLEVLVVGDASGLKKALGTAGTAVNKFGKETERSHGRISQSLKGTFGSALKTAAGFTAAYASIAGAKQAVATTEELAKVTLALHNNLGLSVHSASKWAAVAAARGIDGKALAQSFGTLSKNITAGNAGWTTYTAKLKTLGASEKDQIKRQAIIAKGAGAQADAFRRLGVSQKDLKSLGFNAILGKAADGLERMGPGAERTALSMKLLGRGWQTVLPVMRDGSKAMNEQLGLADKYGVTFKGKTVQSLQDLIAAQREAKFATLGLQVAFGTQLAPVLTSVISKVSGFVREIRDGTGAGGRFRTAVVNAFNSAKAVIEPIVAVVARVTAAIVKSKAAVSALGILVAGLAIKFAFTKMVSGFNSIGTSVTSLGTKFKALTAVGKFGALLGVIGGVAAAITMFGTKHKSAAEAVRGLTEALDAERNAIKRVRDLDLDAAQAKNQARASTLAVTAAQHALTAAIKTYGKNSLQAKEAEVALSQAKVQAKRDTRALADVTGDATAAMRDAATATRAVRQAQLDAISATQGWGAAVNALKNGLAGTAAQVPGLQNALDTLHYAGPRSVGSEGRNLFGVDHQLAAMQGLRDKTQASFDSYDTAAQGHELTRGVAVAAAKLANIKARKKTKTYTAKDKRADTRDARANLDDAGAALKRYRLELGRAKSLSKLDIRIGGLEQTKKFQDAIRSIGDSIKSKLTDGVSKFQDNWEKTAGKIFDAATQAAIDTGPASLALKAAMTEEQKLNDERTDAQQAQSVLDAQAAVTAAVSEADKVAAAKQMADALFEQAETSRQRKITQLQTDADAERARIEETRATDRQAQLDADTAAFSATLSTQLEAEKARLAAGLVNYATFVKSVNDILAGVGVAGLDTSADDEGAINNGPAAPTAPKAPPKKKKPKKHASGGGIIGARFDRILVGELGPEMLYAGGDGSTMVGTASETAQWQRQAGGGIHVSIGQVVNQADALIFAREIAWKAGL